jgi:hypothetical protein
VVDATRRRFSRCRAVRKILNWVIRKHIGFNSLFSSLFHFLGEDIHSKIALNFVDLIVASSKGLNNEELKYLVSGITIVINKYSSVLDRFKPLFFLQLLNLVLTF